VDLSRLGNEFAGLTRRRPVIAAVEIGLVAVAAYVSSALFWVLAAGPFLDVRDGSGDFLGAGAGRAALANLEMLTQLDPFHRELAGMDAAVAGTTAETDLKIVLFGTRLADGNNESTAIIRLENYNHTVLALGDEVSPGVRLEEINRGYVVLSRHGLREALYLHADRTPAQVPRAASGSRAMTQAETGSRSFFDDVELNIRRDGDGRTSGFIVGLAPDSDLEERTGLKDGDVLVAVNGISVGNFVPLTELHRTLRDDSGVNLVVERNGERHAIRLGAR
jgi:general secretion pathway protein C